MTQQPVLPYGAPIHGSHNLPVQPPDQLFGRDPDLTSIHVALKAGTAVLLHGPAGVGKTALAAALASGYAELPGGVLWLDVNDDSLFSLLHRTARSYGVDVQHTGGEPLAMVRNLLRDNRPLVVLDGHLHIEAAREYVRECASSVPLLLTHTQMVSGSWTPHAVSPLEADDAQAMLLNLGDTPFEVDLAEVVRLGQALAGYPLAIRVAALQMVHGNVQPEALLKQIPDLPPGETNRVMGALMAAYRLLPSALQGLVLLLGTAFAGGASDELLADAGGAPVDVIRQTVRQLVHRGFVVEREHYGQTYFVMHETIQSFAQAFLRGKHQLEAMQQRHLKGVLTYTRRHAADDSYAHLSAEMPNVIMASQYAAQHGETGWLDELVSVLGTGSFVVACGFEAEYEWFQQLIEQPELAGEGVLVQSSSAAEVTEFELEAVAEAIPPIEAEPVVAVEPESEPDVLDDVEVEPESAVTGLEPLADVQEQDTVAAGPVWVDSDDFVEDIPPMVPEMFAIPDDDIEIGDIEALERLGQQAVEHGTASQTVEHFTQALETYQADGNIDDELAALEALAALNLEQENFEDVLKYLDQGMALAEESDNPLREGHLLVLLGDLQVMLGKYDGAEMAYQEAVNALRPTESWLDIGLTLDKLGMLYFEQRRFTDAIAIWDQTGPIFERVERLDLLRMTLNYLGDSYAALMQWEKAETHYQQALELARQQNDTQGAYEQYSDLGILMESSGDRERALSYYQHALHLAFDLDNQEQLGQSMLALARLLVDDVSQLYRVVQLLEAAQMCCHPSNTEVRRLLNRVTARRDRLAAADVDLEIPQDSLEEYIRAAVGQSI